MDKNKFYEAIYEYLSESMSPEKAGNQTIIMVDNISSTVKSITTLINRKDVDPVLLSKKFHTLKNLLLYGDFYYESDLCQDIEIELRKSKNPRKIISIYDELIESLKM